MESRLENSRKFRQCLMTTSLLAMCGLAQAAAPRASGGAYDFTVNVSVDSVPILNIGPNDQVQFSDETSAYEKARARHPSIWAVATNALHLHADIAGTISADVVISHARTSIACN